MVASAVAANEKVGKKKARTKKGPPLVHEAYVSRPPESPRICARISSGRPYEALLFESQDRKSGLTSILTALVDRRTGMLALVAEAHELGASEANELRELARSGLPVADDSSPSLDPAEAPLAPPLAVLPLELARIRLSRAILATRIGGREVPAWLSARAELVALIGDPTDPSSRIDDVYLCFACDAPLPIAEQLARAARLGPLHAPPSHQPTPDLGRRDPQARRSTGAHARPPVCPSCRGEAQGESAEGEVWLGRAWLMVAARLPRRALVCAARAEGAKVPPARLHAIRGAALLALGDPLAARSHLARASAVPDPDPRAGGWLEALGAPPDRLDAA